MASVKIEFGSLNTMTLSAASLASSSTKVAGRQSTLVDNSTNKFLDYLVTGKVTTGTSPTTNRSIQLWVFAEFDGTNQIDTFGATDANVTVTDEQVRNGELILAWSVQTNANSNRVYYIRPFSVASLFGGLCPRKWGLWLVHDTAVALNSTAANHAFYNREVYSTVV